MDLTPTTNTAPPKYSSLTMNFKQPSARGKVFEAGLLLIISILVYWFLVSPKHSQLTAAKEQYQNLETQQKDLDANKKQLETAIADLKNHPREIAEMDEALPLDNRVTKLYIVLNDLSQNSGMTVGNISVSFNGSVDMAGNKALLTSPYAAKRTVQKLTTTMVATGSFDQFMALLEKLENSGRLINVTSVNIATGKEGAFNFTFNLEAYFYSQ